MDQVHPVSLTGLESEWGLGLGLGPSVLITPFLQGCCKRGPLL